MMTNLADWERVTRVVLGIGLVLSGIALFGYRKLGLTSAHWTAGGNAIR